jgi:hypothetical protein
MSGERNDEKCHFKTAAQAFSSLSIPTIKRVCRCLHMSLAWSSPDFAHPLCHWFTATLPLAHYSLRQDLPHESRADRKEM